MRSKASLSILLIWLLGFTYAQDCDLDFTVSEDQIICEPSCVNLMGNISGDFLSFEWTNEQGYTNTNDLNPCAPVSEPTTFTLTVNSLDPENLVDNGDFESGNTGFTSEYNFNPGTGLGGLGQGSYNLDVVSPFLWTNCNSPSGIMMVVNGATVTNVNVFCTEVDIDPNTDYVFSADVMNINNPAPILQFSINGDLLGAPFVGGSPCDSEQFYEVWNSGSATVATICIVNQSTVAAGNDFSLDNINFQQLCVQEATFEVFIESPELELFTDLDLLDCNFPIAELYADISPLGDYEYLWTTNNGNFIGDINDETIVVDEEGTYSLMVTDENGCTDIQDIIIDIDQDPPVIIQNIPDTITCLLTDVSLNAEVDDVFAYEWIFDNQNLNLDQSEILVDESGMYTLIVTGENGCTSSVIYDVPSNVIPPTITLTTTGVLDCNNASVNISLFEPLDYLELLWSTGENTPSIDVQQAGVYEITVTGANGCLDSTQIEILNDAIDFQFNLDDIALDCNQTMINYNPGITGAFSTTTWTLPDGSNSSSENIVIDTEGIYYLSVEDDNGCVIIDSLMSSLDTISPSFTYVVDSISCNQSGSISLVTDSDNTILWEIDGQVLLDDEIVYSDQIVEANLTIMSLNGCSVSETIPFVSNVEFPLYILSGNEITCETPESIIASNSDQNLQYNWSGPNNYSSQLSSNAVSESGMYYVTITNQNNCISYDSILITIDTIAPSIDLNISEIGCNSALANISFDDPLANWNIDWSYDGGMIEQGNASFSTDMPGQYTLEVTDVSNGCDYLESFTISNYEPLVLETINTNPNCLDEYGSIEIIQLSGGLPAYIVTLNDVEIEVDNFLIENLVPGPYTLSVSDADNCIVNQTLEISSFTDFSFVIDDNIILETGEQINIEPIFDQIDVDIQSIEWTPSNLVNCSDCLEPIFLGESNSSLTLTITDVNGCTASRTLTIEIPINFWIELPNVFSPHNGDNVNDLFYPFSSNEGIAEVEYLMVYDRWGELVFINEHFPTNSPQEGWNGRFLNEALDPNVFVYVTRILLTDGTFQLRKGGVTLVD